MTTQARGASRRGFDFYGPQYARFDSALAGELRREVYGEDIGQQGWRTAAEQAEIADLVRPGPTAASSTSPAGRAVPRWRWSSEPDVGSPAWTPRPPESLTRRRRPPRAAWPDRATLRRRRLRRAAALRGRHLRRRPVHRRDLPSPRPLRHAVRMGPASPLGRPSPLHRPGGPDRRGRQERARRPRVRRASFSSCPPGLNEKAIEAAGLALAALARTAPRPPPRSPPAGTPLDSAAPRWCSARRAPTGSHSVNASWRSRPSWPGAAGSRDSSTSPRSAAVRPASGRRCRGGSRGGRAGRGRGWCGSIPRRARGGRSAPACRPACP